eukprot:450963-Amphidinium_carterae.2
MYRVQRTASGFMDAGLARDYMSKKLQTIPTVVAAACICDGIRTEHSPHRGSKPRGRKTSESCRHKTFDADQIDEHFGHNET